MSGWAPAIFLPYPADRGRVSDGITGLSSEHRNLTLSNSKRGTLVVPFDQTFHPLHILCHSLCMSSSVNQLHCISSRLAILLEVLHKMAVLDLVLLSLVFKLYPNSLVQKIPCQRRRPLYHFTLDKMVNCFFICYKMSCIKKTFIFPRMIFSSMQN